MTMTITPQVMGKIKELVAEGLSRDEIANRLGVTVGSLQVTCSRLGIWREIAPELTGHGLPLSKCEAYNRVYDQFYQSR
jgi:hypothetical protein